MSPRYVTIGKDRHALAAGALVGRSPQFLSLIQRIYDAYAELRNCRLTIDEIEQLVPIDRELIGLVDNAQPSDRSRRSGYDNDEALLADWTRAIDRLLTDGDALLPAIATGSTATMAIQLQLHRFAAGRDRRDHGRRMRRIRAAPPGESGRAASAGFLPPGARRSPASAIRRPASG